MDKTCGTSKDKDKDGGIFFRARGYFFNMVVRLVVTRYLFACVLALFGGGRLFLRSACFERFAVAKASEPFRGVRYHASKDSHLIQGSRGRDDDD